MFDFTLARQRMVEEQLRRRGLHNPAVLAAMGEVPREDFVEPAARERAYDDTPLPIDAQQTISQPYIVALMLEAAALQPNARVLEIGAGSGYAAAVASHIAARVFTIERHMVLATQATQRLASYPNVEVRLGDGTHGWPEAAPFDAILVAAGAPAVPTALRSQLAVGGRLIIPVGTSNLEQRLRCITRTGASSFDDVDLGGVRFVPLVGDHGWRAGDLT